MGLNVADWIAIAIVLISAVGGFRRGLVLSAFSLVGLAVGAYVGSRVAPHLVHGGSNSKWTPVAALVGLPLRRLTRESGSVVGWTNHILPRSTSFVVELPARALSEPAVARFARATTAVGTG